MRRALLFLLLGVGPAATAQMPTLVQGGRLRVEAPGHRKEIEGTLLSQTADSLTIAALGAVRTTVASASVWRIKESRGKSHGMGAVRGLKIGSAFGAVGGLVVGPVLVSDTGSFARDYSTNMIGLAASSAITGAMFGLVIGAVAGAEKWTTVYSRPTRIGFSRARNGVSVIGLSIRF